MNQTAYRPFGEAAVLDCLRGVTALPTLPAVVSALGRRFNAPDVSAAEIADLLGHDQALTARVLRLANSAFYAPREPVRSPQQAVVLLGLSTVRAITLKASIFTAFPIIEARPFWLHSLGVACAARAIARFAGLTPADDAFVMGLLHDIGKLALAEHLPESYALVRARVVRDGGLIRAAENLELGCDHATVGGFLCSHWSLPIEFRSAISAHHDLERADGPYQAWAACLHLADILARALLIGNGGDHAMPSLDQRALRILALSSDDLPLCFSAAEDELANAEVFFGMIHS
jgi:putative nucleotidyltransferase with HDIG domain